LGGGRAKWGSATIRDEEDVPGLPNAEAAHSTASPPAAVTLSVGPCEARRRSRQIPGSGMEVRRDFVRGDEIRFARCGAIWLCQQHLPNSTGFRIEDALFWLFACHLWVP
jgi:hypothetical protein